MTCELPVGLYQSLRLRAGIESELSGDLYPEQRQFVRSPARRKVALCGRKAGKSHGIAALLFDALLAYPDRRSVYITLSAPKARQILWDYVGRKLSDRYALGLELRTQSGQLMITSPNGSTVWLVGCGDRSEAEKIRGEAFCAIVVDECQGFGDYLEYLVQDAAEPALLDYDGVLALTGTPSAVPVGYWHDVSTGVRAGWEQHGWTVLSNSSLDGAGFLRDVLERNGWTEDTPTYRREYLGQWVEDYAALIYPFRESRNRWRPDTRLPLGLPRDEEYRVGLGIDLGFAINSTAFTLGAAGQRTGKFFALESYTRSRMIPTALAAHVAVVRQRVLDTTGQILRVVVDEGALGAGWAEQMRQMGVACIPAEKREKRVYQELVGGQIENGGIVADYAACAPLIAEAARCQFDPETGLEDSNFVRHCCDSFLYLARALMPLRRLVDPAPRPPAPPRPGTPEAIRAEMELVKQAAIRRHERAKHGRMRR